METAASFEVRNAPSSYPTVADDARSREVRLCHSSWEADEQSDYGRSGAGERRAGAEGNAIQQSTGRAQNRTNRVTGAGAHTVSRHQRPTVTHPRREPCAGIPLARI